jgi:uncharacterized membrane protein YccF (DUF307 family)
MQQQPPSFYTHQPQPKNEPFNSPPPPTQLSSELNSTSQQGEIWHTQPPNSQQMYPPPPYGQPPQQYPQQQQNQFPPYRQPPQQPIYPAPMYGQPLQPYPPQQYLQMPPQSMNVNTIVNVNTQQKGPSFLIRALYFIFIGWWAGFWCVQIGFFLCALIVTLPLGLTLLNRLPLIMTLKQPGQQTKVNVVTHTYAGGVTNMVNVNVTGTQQHPMILRILYYMFIGCWVGYFWASLAYGLCLTILALPLGVIMLNNLPAVLTLRKN